MYITMYIYHMAKRYSIAEARANLPTIVDQAQAGHEIELTRRGEPIAVVISLREFERLRGVRARFGDAYQRFLSTHALADVGLDEGDLDVPREPSAGRAVVL